MKKISDKHKKIFTRVSNVFYTVIFIVLVFFIGTVLFQRIAVGEPVIFGYHLYVIATDSMTPELEVGTVIACQEVDPAELVVGDVVTYVPLTGRLEGQNVTHKIVRIYEDDAGVLTFVTQGVKEGATEDSPFPATQIKGKMVKELTFLAKTYAILRTPYGFIFLIVLPLLAVMVMFIVGYLQTANKEKAMKEAENAAKSGAEEAFLEELKKQHSEAGIEAVEEQANAGKAAAEAAYLEELKKQHDNKD